MSTQHGRVEAALDRLINSPGFRNSPQLAAFISYVVTRTLAGEERTLKAYTIATEALGRGDDFDPQADPIVRVQARRLRLALDHYYMTDGKAEPVRIEMRPGSYVPRFVVVEDAGEQSSRPAGDVNFIRLGGNKPIAGDAGFDDNGPGRLLVLDDEADIRKVVRKVAEAESLSVLDVADVNEFWVAYQAFKPNLIVLDLVMPDADGVEILRQLGHLKSPSRIVLMSGLDRRVLSTAERLGREFGLAIVASVPKPFDLDQLSEALRCADGDDKLSRGELLQAIETGQITAFFQPKIDIAHGGERLAGFEALARWRHPARGIVAPGQFIPLAEQTGDIIPLTCAVISQALDVLQSWNETLPHLTMSVNLSAVSLNDLEIPDRIADNLARRAIAPERLIMEVTESAAIDRDGDIADVLTRLRLKGIGLSVDDFGTGYSSLLGLFKMPFSEIKIDRTFVNGLENSREASSIVSAVVGLAHSLGIVACAEGVETLASLDKLRQIGCDLVQGYHFAKPAPVDEIDALCRRFASPAGDLACSA